MFDRTASSTFDRNTTDKIRKYRREFKRRITAGTKGDSDLAALAGCVIPCAAREWMILGAPVGERGASPLRGGDRRERELELGSSLPPLARPRQQTARLPGCDVGCGGLPAGRTVDRVGRRWPGRGTRVWRPRRTGTLPRLLGRPVTRPLLAHLMPVQLALELGVEAAPPF